METKEYSHPPWMGLLQPVQVKRFDQNRSSCAEMSVVRTIYHRRILNEKGKGKKEGNQWESAQARCVCFTHNKQTKQTQNTFFSRIKLMHLARFLLGTMIGVPIRVSQSHEPLVGYIKIQVLAPLRRVDRIRQTYAGRSTSRPRYTSVRSSAPFASSRNVDSLSTEPRINIHYDLVYYRS